MVRCFGVVCDGVDSFYIESLIALLCLGARCWARPRVRSSESGSASMLVSSWSPARRDAPSMTTQRPPGPGRLVLPRDPTRRQRLVLASWGSVSGPSAFATAWASHAVQRKTNVARSGSGQGGRYLKYLGIPSTPRLYFSHFSHPAQITGDPGISSDVSP